jgi:hypothetical protein
MRFADIRETLIKRTEDDDNSFRVATPRRISPFESGTQKIKPELLKSIGDDIQWPTYNRASRRANGQVKSRKRIRGQITSEAQKAAIRYRFTRNQMRMLQKMDAATPLTFGED